jgi:hypothetical protein
MFIQTNNGCPGRGLHFTPEELGEYVLTQLAAQIIDELHSEAIVCGLDARRDQYLSLKIVQEKSSS